MRKGLFLTAMLAFIFTSSVWAADISGTWTVKMQSPQGADESYDLAIKAVGDNLTITGTHPKLETLAGTGTLKGNAITIKIFATGSMKVVLDFEGTVSGNKMSGTRDIRTAPATGSPDSAPAAGVQGAAPPPGGQGAPGGQAPAGGQGAPGAGGSPAGDSQGGAPAKVGSKAWTAEKK